MNENNIIDRMKNDWIRLLLFVCLSPCSVAGQEAMINAPGRKALSLNGAWNVIIDPTGIGDWRQVWKEHVPANKSEFVEYSFDKGPVLKVPGDFNSQKRELSFYEGTIWYRKKFSYKVVPGTRLFLHFGAVNYMADVYLNGEKLGTHEGGFTPFQFEVTGKISNGTNRIVVKVNNQRRQNGLPGSGYDWLNYGGITRDVDLVETAATFIVDYSIQLKKGMLQTIAGWVRLDGKQPLQPVSIQIPGLGINKKIYSDKEGLALFELEAQVQLWHPEDPKLYKVIIQCETDTIEEEIGFRTIEVRDGKVLLNKQPVFIKGVNIHEENPSKGARAHTIANALVLLQAAKELGCNMVRLAHYPHNEYMVRQAERMGLMVWSELPVYQHVDFADSTVPGKMEAMLEEMISRDKNRCGVIVWSLSNETYPSTLNRDKVLVELTKKCRALDSVRLITHVTNSQKYQDNTFVVMDTLYRYSDLVAINEYIGWYVPWQGKPTETKWKIAFPGKPVFISEFGGEALYGSKYGSADEAASWREEYQEKIYKDQVEMFGTIPNLAGVCPWILFDYRSLSRLHPVYQNGYNRKGLMSDKGKKKKAWYVMRAYYDKM